MEALEIEGQADQEPLAGGTRFAPQRELAEAEYLRDDADHGLDRLFARAIDGFAHRRFELVGHLDLRAGVLRRRVGLRREAVPPTLMMGLTPGRDGGLNGPVGTRLQGGRSPVAMIQGRRVRRAEPPAG